MTKSELKKLIKECVVELEKQQKLNLTENQMLNEIAIKDAINYITSKINKANIIKGLNWLKNGIGQEWKESKEMAQIWSKYVHGKPLNNWEKTTAKEQLKDILKVGFWGVIGISPIPEPIEIPVILALAKLFNVNMIPSAFKDVIDYSQFDTAGGDSSQRTSDKNSPELEEGYISLNDLGKIDPNDTISFENVVSFYQKATISESKKLKRYVANMDSVRTKKLISEVNKRTKIIRENINESVAHQLWFIIIGIILNVPTIVAFVKRFTDYLGKSIKDHKFTNWLTDKYKKELKSHPELVNGEKFLDLIKQTITKIVDWSVSSADKLGHWFIKSIVTILSKIPKIGKADPKKLTEYAIYIYYAIVAVFISALIEGFLKMVMGVAPHANSNLINGILLGGSKNIHDFVYKQFEKNTEHLNYDNVDVDRDNITKAINVIHSHGTLGKVLTLAGLAAGAFLH